MLHELRRHVLLAATKGVGVVFLFEPEPTHAKVSDAEVALNVDQNILRLNYHKKLPSSPCIGFYFCAKITSPILFSKSILLHLFIAVLLTPGRSSGKIATRPGNSPAKN